MTRNRASGVEIRNGLEGESRIPNPECRCDWKDMAVVGRIARPHGLKGQVVINPETDFIERRFAAGAAVWTKSAGGERRLTVASLRLQNGRLIVGFVGFDRIDDVEALAGQELRVPEEELQELEPGTYYEHQLVGCVVETTGGEVVGEVAKVEGGAGGSRLVIEAPRGEILIPLAVDICVKIDVSEKRIRINPPEGLLELNEIRRRHHLPADDRSRTGRRGR
jgi:16S rRNA processing protein RimM